MNHKAFTLIELLVVVAIIGILAAVGVVAYNGYTSSAKKAVVKQNHKNTWTLQGGETLKGGETLQGPKTTYDTTCTPLQQNSNP